MSYSKSALIRSVEAKRILRCLQKAPKTSHQLWEGSREAESDFSDTLRALKFSRLINWAWGKWHLNRGQTTP